MPDRSPADPGEVMPDRGPEGPGVEKTNGRLLSEAAAVVMCTGANGVSALLHEAGLAQAGALLVVQFQ